MSFYWLDQHKVVNAKWFYMLLNLIALRTLLILYLNYNN